MTSYENRKAEIGRRIKKEREALGIKPKEFLKRIYKSEQSTKTLTSWERGERLPDLDSLVLMATEVFDCDIGYLLCDYDEHKRDTADIVEVTGLSEPAADYLRKNWLRIQQDKDAGYNSNVQKQELTAIDTLLQGGRTVLWNIYQYLYGNYDTFSLTTVVDSEGEKDIFDKKVTLCSSGDNNEPTILQAHQMQSVFLLQTQEGLAELRYRLHPPQRDKSGTTPGEVPL